MTRRLPHRCEFDNNPAHRPVRPDPSARSRCVLPSARTGLRSRRAASSVDTRTTPVHHRGTELAEKKEGGKVGGQEGARRAHRRGGAKDRDERRKQERWGSTPTRNRKPSIVHSRRVLRPCDSGSTPSTLIEWAAYRRMACLEFRVHAVLSRLKAERQTVSTTFAHHVKQAGPLGTR